MSKRPVGRPKKGPGPKDIIRDHIPVDDIFNEDELDIYNKLVDIYLKDLDDDDFSANDMDDVINLAINRVMEFRLLKESKDNVGNHLNASSAIERLRKHSNTIKESLSFRRKDRIDPNKYKGFTMADLVAAYDEEKSKQFEERDKEFRKQEAEILEKRKEYSGNKDDKDRAIKQD